MSKKSKVVKAIQGLIATALVCHGEKCGPREETQILNRRFRKTAVQLLSACSSGEQREGPRQG